MAVATELIGSGTVLESPEHGPQLCFQLLLSLPPQGSGPALANWDWAAVTGYESLHGTTWGDYTLIGTYDGVFFTMTRQPQPGPDGDAGTQPEADRFETPCPEPPGGWRVIDPSRTTQESMERTFEEARGLDGYAGAWVDQSINPADGNSDESGLDLMNDPEKLIINVAVTSDTRAAEAELRKIWGGPLCVSHARHTHAELTRVLDEVVESPAPGMLTARRGRDHVELHVVHDDGLLQRELDSRYGPGLVVVTCALQPFTG